MGQFQDTMYKEYPLVIRDVTAAQFAVQAVGAPSHPGIMYRVNGGPVYQWNGSAWAGVVFAVPTQNGAFNLIAGGDDVLRAAMEGSGVAPLSDFSPTGLLSVTGTVAAQYIEIANLVAMKAKPGDVFDIELHFSYTGSTNGKTFSIQAGDVAGTLTPLTNTTRNTASEVYLIGTYRIWIVSATQILRQSSMLVAAGTNTTASMVSHALDTQTGPAKIYAGIQLASAAESASLIAYKITPSRAG